MTCSRATRKDPLHVECLENRCLPSGSTISGFVFHDANNNGLMDPAETPLANSPIELRNAQNIVIGSAITDANGHYQFDHDSTISTAPQTLTKTLTFPATQTNFSLSGLVGQFDPSLGQLLSVQITNSGSITSDIAVENTSAASPSTISATVGGKLTLTGPSGLKLETDMQQNAGTFKATTYDGALDFAGTSGKDFGNNTASGQQSITLTGNDMTPFVGTGSVALMESGQATSSATGGGNVLVGISSTGQAQVTVVYTYLPDNSLKPGNYMLLQTSEPPGYIDGKESRNGVVLNTAPGDDYIPLTLSGGDMPNNDFGELKAASLSGYVFADIGKTGFNDGIMEPGEPGIGNVLVSLDGSDNTGPVHRAVLTDGTGYYKFDHLRLGVYSLTEGPVTGYVDGKDTIGTPGGIAGAKQFTQIQLPDGFDGVNNNFGHLLPVLSAVSGPPAPTVTGDAFSFGPINPGMPTTPILSKGDLLALTDTNQAAMAADAKYLNAVTDAVLGHDADPTSMAGWLGWLHAGHSKAEIVDVIWRSTEHRQRQVTSLYQGIVGAPPSAGELASYVAMFNSGGSEIDVTAAILSSPAATARFPNTNDYVNAVYTLATGRPATLAEETGWTALGLDRRTLAIRILALPESMNALVNHVYGQLLHRNADQGALNYWKGRFYAGETFGDFAKDILLSGEFQMDVA